MLQSIGRNVPMLVRAAMHGRPRLLIVALDQLVPPTALLIAAGLAAALMSMILVGLAGPTLLLGGTLGLLGGALGVAWWRHGRDVLPARMLGQTLRYLLWKLPIGIQFVTRREYRWLRTGRDR